MFLLGGQHWKLWWYYGYCVATYACTFSRNFRFCYWPGNDCDTCFWLPELLKVWGGIHIYSENNLEFSTHILTYLDVLLGIITEISGRWWSWTIGVVTIESCGRSYQGFGRVETWPILPLWSAPVFSCDITVPIIFHGSFFSLLRIKWSYGTGLWAKMVIAVGCVCFIFIFFYSCGDPGLRNSGRNPLWRPVALEVDCTLETAN